MDDNLWIILFLIVFMLHNLEEIFTVETWFKETYPRISQRIPAFFQKELNNFTNMTSAKFSLLVFVVSIFCSLLIVVSILTQHYFIVLGLIFFFGLNLFTHPLQSLLLKCYTPGLWTTLVLIYPFYGLFFYYLFQADILDKGMIMGAVFVMLILLPGFLISHRIVFKRGSRKG